jgi:S-formylglutathione hydrolase FrmB
VYSPAATDCTDPAAMIGFCDQAAGTNRFFYQEYRHVGGHNGHFDFPNSGQHDWGSWGPELGTMSGDLVAAIR